MMSFSPEHLTQLELARARLEESRKRLTKTKSRARSWEKTDDQYPNAIYLGCADERYVYIGQSRQPVARWRSHLLRGTGCTCFGDHTLWAILVWDVPPDCLDAAESYMIGFAMAKWQCVNMNRGKDDEAFAIGFQDSSLDVSPQICNPFDLSDLLWQEIRAIDATVGMYETYVYDQKLWHRRWGFHLRSHDFEKAVSHEVELRMKPLREGIDHHRNTLRQQESSLSYKVDQAFYKGLFFGAVWAAVLVLVICFA